MAPFFIAFALLTINCVLAGLRVGRGQYGKAGFCIALAIASAIIMAAEIT